MYKMFFPSGNAEEFCDHVFRTFDMDKNGYIDFKVCVFVRYIKLPHMYETKLKKALYLSCDNNKDLKFLLTLCKKFFSKKSHAKRDFIGTSLYTLIYIFSLHERAFKST